RPSPAPRQDGAPRTIAPKQKQRGGVRTRRPQPRMHRLGPQVDPTGLDLERPEMTRSDNPREPLHVEWQDLLDLERREEGRWDPDRSCQVIDADGTAAQPMRRGKRFEQPGAEQGG